MLKPLLQLINDLSSGYRKADSFAQFQIVTDRLQTDLSLATATDAVEKDIPLVDQDIETLVG